MLSGERSAGLATSGVRDGDHDIAEGGEADRLARLMAIAVRVAARLRLAIHLHAAFREVYDSVFGDSPACV